MTTDDLDSLSPDDLDIVFATEIAEWKPTTDGGICWDHEGKPFVPSGRYGEMQKQAGVCDPAGSVRTALLSY